jgi:two-component system sensor histidine kinase CiaH
MFNNARLKLTAWYLLIISLISLAFSLVIYRVIGLEIDRFARSPRFRIQVEQDGPLQPGMWRFNNQPAIDPDLISLVDETKNRFLLNLLTINGAIIAVSGVLSYILAGRTLKPIKDMVDEQNRFISDASHELRTPLTSLKSAFEVYLRDKKATLKESRILAKESIVEVDKLQDLSNSLLELARFKNPQFTFNPKRLNLQQIISPAILRVKSLAATKNINIIDNTKSFDVYGDLDKLVDLFVILLDNAIKYSPSKSDIFINSNKYDGKLVIQVEDSGIGISKKDIPRIFDRFYRSDNARARNGTGGYGLGLSIAKEIAQVHHAEIKVASQLNKGSTFSVVFQFNNIK